jgi:hypothetical protein
VYLAYLDDAGNEKPASSVMMYGAVIISPNVWGGVENLHSTAISDMIPIEEIDDRFQEFHATELFNGEGPFKDIDQQSRFNAIRTLSLVGRVIGGGFGSLLTCPVSALSGLSLGQPNLADQLRIPRIGSQRIHR